MLDVLDPSIPILSELLARINMFFDLLVTFVQKNHSKISTSLAEVKILGISLKLSFAFGQAVIILSWPSFTTNVLAYLMRFSPVLVLSLQ